MATTIADSCNGSLPDDFKLENLQKYFAQCVKEDGSLDMENYILGMDWIHLSFFIQILDKKLHTRIT